MPPNIGSRGPQVQINSKRSSSVQGRFCERSNARSQKRRASMFNCDENEINIDSFYELTDLWVFGYGSILWNTGFKFENMQVGYVKGYSRRFWQGNTTHRGTPSKPGRVATLVPKKESRVWGAAYHLTDESMVHKCLEHLGMRECHLGGYVCQLVPFTARSSSIIESSRQDLHHLALVFIATPSSSEYLGPACLDELASQILACRGKNGTNVEYVLRLAEYVRKYIPEDDDDHLFGLESKIRERLQSQPTGESMSQIKTDHHDRTLIEINSNSESTNIDKAFSDNHSQDTSSLSVPELVTDTLSNRTVKSKAVTRMSRNG